MCSAREGEAMKYGFNKLKSLEEALDRVMKLSESWQQKDPGYGLEYDSTKLLSYYHAAEQLRNAIRSES
jgi:hypothetical protein